MGQRWSEFTCKKRDDWGWSRGDCPPPDGCVANWHGDVYDYEKGRTDGNHGSLIVYKDRWFQLRGGHQYFRYRLVRSADNPTVWTFQYNSPGKPQHPLGVPIGVFVKRSSPPSTFTHTHPDPHTSTTSHNAPTPAPAPAPPLTSYTVMRPGPPSHAPTDDPLDFEFDDFESDDDEIVIPHDPDVPHVPDVPRASMHVLVNGKWVPKQTGGAPPSAAAPTRIPFPAGTRGGIMDAAARQQQLSLDRQMSLIRGGARGRGGSRGGSGGDKLVVQPPPPTGMSNTAQTNEMARNLALLAARTEANSVYDAHAHAKGGRRRRTSRRSRSRSQRRRPRKHRRR